ncbi:MAG: RDD family protein [Desulfuromonadaceae bacterium]|nr:RDD family protein [Desulfuromonadaceae bacterium]
MNYAGFWRRFASILIDALVFSPFMLLRIWLDSVSTITAMVAAIAYIFFIATYDIWFIAKYGQTPGKMAVGIKVVKVDGSVATLKEAFLRHSVNIIFAIINGVVLCYVLSATTSWTEISANTS